MVYKLFTHLQYPYMLLALDHEERSEPCLSLTLEAPGGWNDRLTLSLIALNLEAWS